MTSSAAPPLPISAKPRTLVTAFGPFGGRSENASNLALKQLRQAQPWVRTRTFPVDSVIAPKMLRAALRQIKPDLVIHLGEAGGTKSIHLEESAWNLMDFGIPDNAGRQPQSRCISPGCPNELRTPLPVGALRSHLSDQGFPVVISNNPGRYLCNQVYYISRLLGERALFVHLPFTSEMPTNIAAKALELTVSFLTKAPR